MIKKLVSWSEEKGRMTVKKAFALDMLGKREMTEEEFNKICWVKLILDKEEMRITGKVKEREITTLEFMDLAEFADIIEEMKYTDNKRKNIEKKIQDLENRKITDD
jgi:hypothetical protein